MATRNRRREDRTPLSLPAMFQWEDEYGESLTTRAKTVDISTAGLSLEIIRSVPPRSIVTFRLLGLNLGGRASVRSSYQKGMNFRIGLEFLGGLRWQPGPAPKPRWD